MGSSNCTTSYIIIICYFCSLAGAQTGNWNSSIEFLVAALFCFMVFVEMKASFLITIKNKVEVKMSTILKTMAAGSAYMGRFNRSQLFFVPET